MIRIQTEAMGYNETRHIVAPIRQDVWLDEKDHSLETEYEWLRIFKKGKMVAEIPSRRVLFIDYEAVPPAPEQTPAEPPVEGAPPARPKKKRG